jgi:serine/threonine protein kinase
MGGLLSREGVGSGMIRERQLAAIEDDLSRSLSPRYELRGLLGMGAMGAVFEAHEPALQREVAVKVLRPKLAGEPTARAKFEREGRTAAALSHPNAVRVYTVGSTDTLKLPYIVMQHVDGPSLSEWIGEAGRASEKETRRIVGEVAAALAQAHSRGLVHRDIKPSNILIEAESGRAYLTDFGLTLGVGADEESAADENVPRVAGTPPFMSPEQAAGDPVGSSSDVYSLGLVAYELLSGRRPFRRRTAMGWRVAHINDDPEPLRTYCPDVSAEVALLVERCLSKRPELRPTAGAFSDALLPGLLNEIVWPPPGLYTLWGSSRRLGIRAMALGAIVGLLVILMARPPEAFRPDQAWWSAYSQEQAASGSALGIVSERGSNPNLGAALTVWRIVLPLGGILATIGLAFGAFSLARHAERLRKARSAGWRWSTLLDVLADPDGRTGLLLTGARDLATILPGDRDEARRSRRWQAALPFTGGAWLLLTPGTYAWLMVLGWLPRLEAGPVIPLRFALAILGPPVLLLGGWLWMIRMEARALGQLARRQPYAPALARSSEPPRAEATARWYAGLEGVSPSAGSGGNASARLTRFTLWGGLVGIAGVEISGLIALTTAAMVSAGAMQRVGQLTAAADRMLDMPLHTYGLDRVWPGWRALPQDEALVPMVQAPDPGEDLRVLLRPLGGAEEPTYDQELLAAFNRYGVRIDSLIAVASNLRPETLRLARLAADHPRTVAMRRLARADRVDLISAVDQTPLGGYTTLSSLPEPAYGRIREGVTANALGAVAMLAAGDTSAAEARLFENAVLAQRIAEDPRLFAARFAVGLAQNLALLPLARLAEVRADTMSAITLRESLEHMRELTFHPAWLTGLAGFAANPGDMSAWRAVVADPSLPSGLRVAALQGAWTGFCLDPREILAGVDPNRSRVALAAASAIDLPQGAGIGPLAERSWRSELRPLRPWLLAAISYCMS